MNPCIIRGEQWGRQSNHFGLVFNGKNLSLDEHIFKCCEGRGSVLDPETGSVYICKVVERVALLNAVLDQFYPDEKSRAFVIDKVLKLNFSPMKLQSQWKMYAEDHADIHFFAELVYRYWIAGESCHYYNFAEKQHPLPRLPAQIWFVKLTPKLIQSHHLLNFTTIIQASYNQNIRVYLDASNLIKRSRSRRSMHLEDKKFAKTWEYIQKVLPEDSFAKLSSMLRL